MKFIKTKVDSLIQKYETNCPFKIAKSKGILIQFEYLGNILGYYSKHFRIPIIHINESVSEQQQLFICAHELGHAVLHHNVNTPFLKKNTLFSTERIEVEANTFAIELLFRKGAINDVITLKEAIEKYGIPKQLLLSEKIFDYNQNIYS